MAGRRLAPGRLSRGRHRRWRTGQLTGQWRLPGSAARWQTAGNTRRRGLTAGNHPPHQCLPQTRHCMSRGGHALHRLGGLHLGCLRRQIPLGSRRRCLHHGHLRRCRGEKGVRGRSRGSDCLPAGRTWSADPRKMSGNGEQGAAGRTLKLDNIRVHPEGQRNSNKYGSFD